MRPSTIRYYVHEALNGLRMNLLMTFASIVAVMACISIMSFSYCIVSNLQYMLGQMEDSIGIAVFLKGDLSSDEIERMKSEIESLDNVVSATYVSPDDALDELKMEWGADEDIFEGLDGENNPLSHSFKIVLTDISHQDEVLQKLQDISGIENMSYAKTETEILMKLSNVFQIVGILVMLILGVISVMIIVNTIKISVVNRRVEINIMKYVGATDWFIRWPFVIEGIIIGLIGAIIPTLIGWPLYAKCVSLIYEYVPLIQNLAQFRLSGDVYSVLLPCSLLFGVLLGVVGSTTSIRKHLRV